MMMMMTKLRAEPAVFFCAETVIRAYIHLCSICTWFGQWRCSLVMA